MMLTDKSEIGFRILMRLSLQKGSGFLPLATLADELGISIFVMKQPITALRAAGLVRGERGWNGGYILARPATRITVANIVDAIDRPVCANEAGGLSLYGLWDEIGGRLGDFLSSITLASLAADAKDNADAVLEEQRFAGGIL